MATSRSLRPASPALASILGRILFALALASGIVSAAGRAAATGSDSSAAGAGAEASQVAWFTTLEQSLMDSIAKGDKAPWEAIMDPTYVVTSEEGDVIDRARFLAELRPLPAGLKGSITVQDLTVQEFPTFVVVRFRADELESVFGQELRTKYRTTDTYRRDGGGWKLVASHFAVVTQDPPAQQVSKAGWPGLVGTYRVAPEGWTFTVELRDGELWGSRD